MTHEHLQSIARNRGWIRWTQSGVVERLRLAADKKGTVLAQGVFTVPHRVGVRQVHDCVQVDAKKLTVCANELMSGVSRDVGNANLLPTGLRRVWDFK